MDIARKYQPPPPVVLPGRAWPGRALTQAPRFMAVDLRDGNQALPAPLDVAEKRAYFALLCRLGFKEIEIAYPAASHAEFAFAHELVTSGAVPADVTPAVLSPCRPDLLERTLDAVAGAPRALVHLYLAVSELHLREVLRLTRDEAVALVVAAVRQVRARAGAAPGTRLSLEFSPEEFTDADPVFSREVCAAVFEAWGRATPQEPVIFNLPATVERRPPNQYADMVEDFCNHLPRRDRVVVSLHPHNDQGMALAAAELGLLAGAERLEGALFGQGERTGNLDLVAFAGNLLSRGIDPGLDLSHLPEVAAQVESLTGMKVGERQPYSGKFVFTAFSGTHQDAIRKGLDARERDRAAGGAAPWRVPYLHVDPADFGRGYEELVRLTSQSGKGGAAWVLERRFGIKLPPFALPVLGAAAQAELEAKGGEMTPDALFRVFYRALVEPEGPYQLVGYWPNPDPGNPYLVHGVARVRVDGVETETRADGNGPVSAFTQAFQKIVPETFSIADYHEQALDRGEDARALSCVALSFADGSRECGVGINTNITQATAHAVIAAVNRRASARRAAAPGANAPR